MVNMSTKDVVQAIVKIRLLLRARKRSKLLGSKYALNCFFQVWKAEVEASCWSFSGFSSEEEGLEEGRGRAAAWRGAGAAGAAPWWLCSTVKISSEHLSSTSEDSSTSSRWSRALAYLRVISESMWVCFSSFSSLSLMRSSEVKEYWLLRNWRRFPISFSQRVWWPLIEEYERRTSSKVISDSSSVMMCNKSTSSLIISWN